jgi:hypothetical protein
VQHCSFVPGVAGAFERLGADAWCGVSRCKISLQADVRHSSCTLALLTLKNRLQHSNTAVARACLQSEPELLSKYKQSHLESYMEDNQRVAFCPSVPWCGRAVEVSADAAFCRTGRHVVHAMQPVNACVNSIY